MMNRVLDISPVSRSPKVSAGARGQYGAVKTGASPASPLLFTCFDVCEDFISVGCSDGSIRFFDIDSYELIGSYSTYEIKSRDLKEISVIKIHPQNCDFILFANDCSVLVVEHAIGVRTWTSKKYLRADLAFEAESPILGMCFSRDGELLIGCENGDVLIVALKMDDTISKTYMVASKRILHRFETEVVQMDIKDNLLFCSTTRTAALFKIDSFFKEEEYRIDIGTKPREGVYGGCFSINPVGTTIISAARPGNRTWNVTLSSGDVESTSKYRSSFATIPPAYFPSSTMSEGYSLLKHQLNYNFCRLLNLGEYEGDSRNYMVSWGSDVFFLLDTHSATVLEWHVDIPDIVLAVVFESTIYILTRKDKPNEEAESVLYKLEMMPVERCILNALPSVKAYDSEKLARIMSLVEKYNVTDMDILNQVEEACTHVGRKNIARNILQNFQNRHRKQRVDHEKSSLVERSSTVADLQELQREEKEAKEEAKIREGSGEGSGEGQTRTIFISKKRSQRKVDIAQPDDDGGLDERIGNDIIAENTDSKHTEVVLAELDIEDGTLGESDQLGSSVSTGTSGSLEATKNISEILSSSLSTFSASFGNIKHMMKKGHKGDKMHEYTSTPVELAKELALRKTVSDSFEGEEKGMELDSETEGEKVDETLPTSPAIFEPIPDTPVAHLDITKGIDVPISKEIQDDVASASLDDIVMGTQTQPVEEDDLKTTQKPQDTLEIRVHDAEESNIEDAAPKTGAEVNTNELETKEASVKKVKPSIKVVHPVKVAWPNEKETRALKIVIHAEDIMKLELQERWLHKFDVEFEFEEATDDLLIEEAASDVKLILVECFRNELGISPKQRESLPKSQVEAERSGEFAGKGDLWDMVEGPLFIDYFGYIAGMDELLRMANSKRWKYCVEHILKRFSYDDELIQNPVELISHLSKAGSLPMALTFLQGLLRAAPAETLEYCISSYPMIQPWNLYSAEASFLGQYLLRMIKVHDELKMDSDLLAKLFESVLMSDSKSEDLIFEFDGKGRKTSCFKKGAHTINWDDCDSLMEIITHPEVFSYDPDHILEVCTSFGFVPGSMYLYVKTMNIKKALELIIGCDDRSSLDEFINHLRGVGDWIILWQIFLHLCRDNSILNEMDGVAVVERPNINGSYLIGKMCEKLYADDVLNVMKSIMDISSSISKEVYSKILLLFHIELEKTTVARHVVRKMNEHLLAKPFGGIPPYLSSILSAELGIEKEKVPVFECLKNARMDDYLSNNLDFKLKTYYEESCNHWGVRRDIENDECPVCSLPLGDSVGANIIVFPCNHAYHQPCIPEEACVVCFKNNMKNISLTDIL